MIEVNENLTQVLGVMVPIIAIVGAFSLAFGIRYLKSRERMEMISRGMDISAFKDVDLAATLGKQSKRSPLRSGLVSLGAGLGVLLAYLLCNTVIHGDDKEFIYIAMVAVFVGLALIISHIMEEKKPEGQSKD